MKTKIIMCAILLFSIFILFQTNVKANSYTIENMDIQATVQKNGDVNIEQKITYSFEGSYNGIYVTIPYNFSDENYNNIIKKKKINDKFYNGNSVWVNQVSELVNGEERIYKLSYYGTNGMEGIYISNAQNRNT